MERAEIYSSPIIKKLLEERNEEQTESTRREMFERIWFSEIENLPFNHVNEIAEDYIQQLRSNQIYVGDYVAEDNSDIYNYFDFYMQLESFILYLIN